MPNRFEQQVVQDEMLETLSGGNELIIDDLLKDLESQIHEIDENGPRYPPGPHGIGDIYKFTDEFKEWQIKHPEFHYRPIQPA